MGYTITTSRILLFTKINLHTHLVFTLGHTIDIYRLHFGNTIYIPIQYLTWDIELWFLRYSLPETQFTYLFQCLPWNIQFQLLGYYHLPKLIYIPIYFGDIWHFWDTFWKHNSHIYLVFNLTYTIIISRILILWKHSQTCLVFNMGYTIPTFGN